ncbi:hypothetical protein SD70_21745 [Gordoniibacillus kamchatkensis]|uniref:Uncharacterized protein n=1 Tax=Gordoniibacillus kamchatkensis TaxID=1590651 RepID=A0ABR5ADY2_9BACL|nr:SiaB family protein kinase [Paenibacillus sp. VKM B-2647]KIL39171.1 hypothetical protein SD70_21745 [Paenibacillus sp. VKM B-2647]
MIDNHLLEVQAALRNNGILISFSGWLSQQLIEEYGQAIKMYLEAENRPKNEIYHIFSIFIEQTQNIKNYCLRKSGSPACDRIAQSSIVTIGKNASGSYICSGNLIENEDAAGLIARIESIVKLDKDELRRLYKEKLKLELPDHAGGAGLGFIDMARKATQPLEFSATKVDEHLSFFALKAVV